MSKNVKPGKSSAQKFGLKATDPGMRKTSKSSPQNSPRSSIDDGSASSKDKRRPRSFLSSLKFSKTSPKAGPKAKQATAKFSATKSSPNNSLSSKSQRPAVHSTASTNPGTSYNDRVTESSPSKVVPTGAATAGTLHDYSNTDRVNHAKTEAPMQSSSTSSNEKPSSADPSIPVPETARGTVIVNKSDSRPIIAADQPSHHIAEGTDHSIPSSQDSVSSDHHIPSSPDSVFSDHHDEKTGKEGDAASRAMRQRKFSLSKSGRLKETKQRMTVTSTFDGEDLQI